MFPLGAVFKLNKYLKLQAVTGEHMVFRMFTAGTAVVLAVASLFTITTQLVGTPILCFGDKYKEDIDKAITTFCWITTTYAVPEYFNRTVGTEVIAPGVGPEHAHSEKKYYVYYQWVCFVLFFQSLLCYAPKLIWSSLEDGLLEKLVGGLNNPCLETCSREKEKLVTYFLKYRKNHKVYVFNYWCCEVLAFTNVVVQMWVMDWFLGGEFFTYGTKVLQFWNSDQLDRVDPMIYIFPRLTKCRFNRYGPSGTVQLIDRLCVLPLNVINEKTYIMLWFWYIAIAILLGGVLLTRYICLLERKFRVPYDRVVQLCIPGLRPRLLSVRARVDLAAHAYTVSCHTDIGDWWLLYVLSKNMNPLYFRDFIADLGRKLNEKCQDPTSREETEKNNQRNRRCTKTCLSNVFLCLE